MSAIPWTQFMRPNGLAVPRLFDIEDEMVSRKATELLAAGYRFECEMLQNGSVSLTICKGDEDCDIEIIHNGPRVPAAIDRLIMRFKPEEEQ